ncbi:proliferating cell nuclear antigen (pcna) [Candidatus Woesearchaeota archaeon]|nr:proliferating cell nuclear antigen (pcna) [Candidatus Woesearchaeota archaeon]
MNLLLSEPRFLKEPISIISDIVNEVKFKFDSDKIELTAMDPAKISLVNFKILSSAFVEYEVQDRLELALSLESLKSVLNRAKSSDTIKIELDKNKNCLKIQLKGETTRTFNISLLELDEEEKKIPDLNFPLKIDMHSVNLNDAIDDISVVSDAVALIAHNDKLILEAESSVNSAKVEIPKSESVLINLKGDSVKSRYGTEYLKKFLKGSKISESVSLEFGKDYPIRINYLVKDKLELSFIMAPRVPND